MTTPFTLSRILMPVEFSDRCRGAACYAKALARHFQAEMTLLHVVTMPYVGYGDVSAYCSADYLEGRWEQGRADLDGFLRDMPDNVRTERFLMEGDPASRIVEYAHSRNVDLIVMPTHGYGPLRRFLLGSVTAKVLHDANCPVWTGPHIEQPTDCSEFALRRILCAVDLGPQSCAALKWAWGMAHEFSAALSIVHVLPSSTTTAGGFTFDPEWRVQMEHDARQRMADVQQQIGAEGEVHVVVGDAPAAISETVRHLKADLLVIGRSHGAGVLGRLRATAYAILRESPCPVASI